MVINPGETIGIIGHTGSGKSTLVNLISRLFDVEEGEVMVDGRNVKEYKLSELRTSIGYVPQETFLFLILLNTISVMLKQSLIKKLS